ncbi:MAG: hypothetical protein HKN12_02440 [Gemmatimonadetes bacterium]|nr:hypothetical protein [Gemmatimonadota bacterium]
MSETTSTSASAGRFRGLPREAAEFFRALEQEPCPDTMPGNDRAAYAAHVLSPLKALVSDLKVRLADVTPRLGLEARVGASLSWPEGNESKTEDCPVRRLRIWDAARSPDASPVLHATFHARGIEVGLEGGADLTVERFRERLGHVAGVTETVDALARDGWILAFGDGLRTSRILPWEDWIDEPGFLDELIDHFRQLLPLFDAIRRPQSAPAE